MSEITPEIRAVFREFGKRARGIKKTYTPEELEKRTRRLLEARGLVFRGMAVKQGGSGGAVSGGRKA